MNGKKIVGMEPRNDHQLQIHMKRYFYPAFAVLLALASSAGAVSIVVDSGRYPTAEAASSAEAEARWLDADPSDDTVCTESFAALELQRYLRRITGREDDFPIVGDQSLPDGELILIGGPVSNAASRKLADALGVKDQELASLGPEGYRIKTKVLANRTVTLIAGGGRAGTLYGVYDLLHRLGCRWFAPGELHEEIPRGKWEPRFDVTERPAFAIRGFYVYAERGEPEFWLWMARNRLNDWYAESKHLNLLHKLGFRLVCGQHDAQWRFINPGAPYPYQHPRWKADRNLPADPYPISDQYQGDADGNGVLSNFEAHPEWFPLAGGKRIPGIGREEGVNFCTSNPDAVQEFTKNYVEALSGGCYREANAVNLWTLDNGKWCECPACQAQGNATDRFLRLVQAFHNQIKRAQHEGKLAYPIQIRFLVYSDLINPPSRPLPEDFDYESCVAAFFPISRCLVHPFDDPSCGRNADYQKKFSGWFLDPARHYRGNILIGEYYNVSRYESLPLCLMHVMAHDIPFHYQAGVRNFQYMHVTTGHWGNKALTNYQMARQLWDVRTDCETLWKDYFDRCYGPATGVMRRFYTSLEAMYSNVEPLKGWSSNLAARLESGVANLFPEPHLRYQREPGVACDAPTLTEMIAAGRECRRLIDEALALPLPKRFHLRILEDERTFTYGERTLAYYDACVQAFQQGRSGRIEEARHHFAEARRLADLLRQDTWSVALCYIHDEPFPFDAFHATRATKALLHLEKLLGPLPEEKKE